ncbi:MAG TPA: Coq4 family protein [Kofleriaceae bacterium]|nr:Coq4 family protein [Kofleriaceae bacterium]
MNSSSTTPPRSTDRSHIVDVADLPPHIRWARALRALGRILRNPEETDQVLVFSNLANAGRRDPDELNRLFTDPQAARLFREQRALDSKTIDVDVLAALPEGTLGRAYATFMKAHGLTPNVFDGSPDDVRDERAAYLIQRMRQTHDLWHVVTNCETDPAGEIALQAFTYAQVRAPSSAILALLGTLKSLRYTRDVAPDALELYRAGAAAKPLVFFPWEDHWATPLVDVRRLLGLPANPRKVGGYLTEAMTLAA